MNFGEFFENGIVFVFSHIISCPILLLSEVTEGIKSYPLKHKQINCSIVYAIEILPLSHFLSEKITFSRKTSQPKY